MHRASAKTANSEWREGRPCLRVVTIQGALLGSLPLGDAGVEVEGVSGSPDGEPIQEPRPQRFQGRRDCLRGEPPDDAGDGRGAREPAKAEVPTDRDIGLQDRELHEAARAGQNTREEHENDRDDDAGHRGPLPFALLIVIVSCHLRLQDRRLLSPLRNAFGACNAPLASSSRSLAFELDQFPSNAKIAA